MSSLSWSTAQRCPATQRAIRSASAPEISRHVDVSCAASARCSAVAAPVGAASGAPGALAAPAALVDDALARLEAAVIASVPSAASAADAIASTRSHLVKQSMWETMGGEEV